MATSSDGPVSVHVGGQETIVLVENEHVSIAASVHDRADEQDVAAAVDELRETMAEVAERGRQEIAADGGVR